MIANVGGLNKDFESKIRLGIMLVLMANESVDFTTMKSLLELTDGNLASHGRSLEELGYIDSEQQVSGRKPRTSYTTTDLGRAAFSAHIQALASFINTQQ